LPPHAARNSMMVPKPNADKRLHVDVVKSCILLIIPFL